MLEDTLAELIEIYLRRADVKQETIERCMTERNAITLAARWLKAFAASDEETLEDNPLEW